MKKKLLAVFYWIHTGFVAAASLVAVAVVLFYLCGIRMYAVETGSMEPAIPVNSLCIVNQRVPFGSIRVDDVIAFRVGEHTMVTHRVAAVEGDSFVTKGDANNAEDAALVYRENYVGKTIYSVPKLGRAIRFLRTLPGICAAVALYLLLMLSNIFLDKPEHKAKKSKERRV